MIGSLMPFLLFGACIIVLLILHFRCLSYEKILSEINDVLHDIEEGSTRRKLLVQPDSPASSVCFQINRIVEDYNCKITLLNRQTSENKQLLTSLSHDLRTPLASLMGYLEAIEMNYISESEKKEYLSVAVRKSRDLKEMVDTLFEWFKLDAGEKEFLFENEDVNELTRVIVADFIPLLEKRHMQYEISIESTPLYAHLDKACYRRIISNLISNALLHSQGTLLAVSIKEEKNRIAIEVRDNGKGISQKDLPHIFDRLYKCDESRSHQSSGLGLSIAKALVVAHNGKITVSSMPNAFTSFCILLPRAKM